MADLRKTHSFTCFRRRRQQMRRSSQPIAHPPAEDADNFSYLVEDGVLVPGNEHEVYYKFVTELVDDATRFSNEVSTYLYLRNTRGSAGADLFRLANKISYFKGEMDKMERELTALDWGPKDLAILEVVLRIARDRFDDISRPGELRSCVEELAAASMMHPLQTRKNRSTLNKACECLLEARQPSAQCRIGMIRQHRDEGKLKDVEASVREVMLPAGQLKEVRSQDSRPRTPWSPASTSSLRAPLATKNQPMDTTATSLLAQRVKQRWKKKQEMGAALVTAYAFPVPLGTD